MIAMSKARAAGLCGVAALTARMAADQEKSSLHPRAIAKLLTRIAGEALTRPCIVGRGAASRGRNPIGMGSRLAWISTAKDSPNGGFSKRFIRHMILASDIILLSALIAISRAISLSVVPSPQLSESSRYWRENHWYMRAFYCSQILYAK
jgi:hypothetical protein